MTSRPLYTSGHRLALALALIGLLAAGAAGVRHVRIGAAARAAFPQDEGHLEVTGPEAPLEILRDARGIPHVLAASEADAYFGLGFAHAQDRLGQMLWLLRCAQGRTAESEGPRGLPADRLARVLGLARLAEEQHAALPERARSLLAAYTRGVNARIERIRSGAIDPPLSLARAAIEIDDWRPSDSLAVAKLYAWSLGGSLDASLVLDDLVQRLGGFAASRFFPGGAGTAPETSPPGRLAGLGAGLGADPLRRAARLEGRSIGSTAWVVGGAHTASGLPILAADSHHQPTTPPHLHVAHVRGGDLEVSGATLPGVPVFWTGHNSRVAWASTLARISTSELYIETLRASGGGRYHDGRRWRPLEKRQERIQVRGAEDEVLTIRATRHGPLVNPALAGEREPLALRWAGAEPAAGSLAAFADVARARDADELLAALALHAVPPVLVAYADASGAAGRKLAGWIPRRAIDTNLVPVPGRARHYDWDGPIGFERLPGQRLRRGRGWLVAADAALAGDEDEPPIPWLWRHGERARRVDELLRAATRRGPLELRWMTALLRDVRMRRAESTLRSALRLAGAPAALSRDAREIHAVLSAWDAEAGPESHGAAAFHVFLESLTSELLRRHLGEELLERYLALPQVDPPALVASLLHEAAAGGDPGGWSDAELAAEAVRASLRQTWLRLSYRLGPNRERWRWGNLHRLSFRSLGPGPARELASGLPYGGSSSTVDPADFDRARPFEVRAAAIWRFAVDASALDEALFALAPGISEHEAHPHARDGIEPWISGKTGVLVSSRLLVEETAVSRLRLSPAP